MRLAALRKAREEINGDFEFLEMDLANRLAIMRSV